MGKLKCRRCGNTKQFYADAYVGVYLNDQLGIVETDEWSWEFDDGIYCAQCHDQLE